MPPYQQSQTPYQPTSAPQPAHTPPASHHSGGAFDNKMLIIAALGLATVAFIFMAIYFAVQNNKSKSNLDEHLVVATEAAKTEQKTQDEKDFAEELKDPYRTYTAPAVIGSLSVKFPKNWNVYADENQEAAQLDVFMNPDVVRDEGGFTGPYSLRIKLEKRIYADAVASLKNDIEKGDVTAKAVKVSGIAGTRFTGLVIDGAKGVLIMLPLRDKTLSIWTEGDDFVKDFDKIIAKIKIAP